MTQGSFWDKIVLFSLPLMLTGVLQLLFSTADLVVIGQFSKTPKVSLAAVSSNGSLVNLIITVALGLSVGANVVLARAIGARNADQARKTVHTSLVLALITGIIFGLVGFFGAPLFLTWMKTDPAIMEKATTYLRIYFLGMPANLVYNFTSSLMRADGDTKHPLYFLAAGGVLNVILNIVFVACFDMDVAGVAVATIVSQYVSAVLNVITMSRSQGYLQLRLKELKIHKAELRSIVQVGLPSGMLNSCFSIANVIIQTSINKLGAVYGIDLVTGSSTSGNVEGFVYVAMNAFASAATTFAGQNFGAKKYKRIKTTMWVCSLLVVIANVVVGGLVLLFGRQICGLYAPGEEQVIDFSMQRMWVLIPIYFLCSIAEVLAGGLNSMGHSGGPMIVSFFSICVFRLVWVYTACVAVQTPEMLYLSYPISWVLDSAAMLLLFVLAYRKLIRSDTPQPPRAGELLETQESV